MITRANLMFFRATHNFYRTFPTHTHTHTDPIAIVAVDDGAVTRLISLMVFGYKFKYTTFLQTTSVLCVMCIAL